MAASSGRGWGSFSNSQAPSQGNLASGASRIFGQAINAATAGARDKTSTRKKGKPAVADEKPSLIKGTCYGCDAFKDQIIQLLLEEDPVY